MEIPADTDLQPVATYGPYVFVPLYGFASDADLLEFCEGLQICNYGPEKLELLLEHWDYLKQYLQIFPTTYLIQVRPPEVDFSMRVRKEADQVHVTYEAALKSFDHAYNVVEALRLFKPGCFARGPCWFCAFRESHFESEGEPAVLGLPVCLALAPGDEPVSLPGGEGAAYYFELAELEPFKKFRAELTASIESLATFPKLRLALSYFNASFGQKPRENQVIDLFICLEALLLQENDELTFRLATRAANLLGADASERKRVFAEVKEFYNLRSKIVHGEVLKPRETQSAQNVDRLRELVRRVLLRCVALALELGLAIEFFKALDETSLDDSVRLDIQRKASRFLYRHQT
jgi:hypothetical protein